MKTIFPFCLATLLFAALTLSAQDTATKAVPEGASILLTAEGRVEVAPAGSASWSRAETNQVLNPGDRVRTGRRSRAAIRLSNLTVLRVKELSTLEIRPQTGTGNRSSLDVRKGSIYLFHRGRPGSVPFRTPVASGAIRGTEFHLRVADNGRTEIAMLDGQVALNNEAGDVVLNGGEQGVVEPGQAPRKTPALNATNIIQWVLYYPAVLEVEEAGLTDQARQTLAASLSAYRSGDLLQAVALYPENRQPTSDAERIYEAALLLAAGNVASAEASLSRLPATSALANALRKVVATVKNQALPAAPSARPATATEWLAESYYQQSRLQLAAALAAARKATEISPRFGFAWVRLAELEFSFGRTGRANDALQRSLHWTPRNAQALALSGFLAAARNQNRVARDQFNQAIAIDGGLGNAWLGRGLIRIRTGDIDGGVSDLQVAATLEPNRAVLRSYLGKGWARAGEADRAGKELGLAQKLDPHDPTAWLYSALLRQQENRVNEGIRDLEQSQALNDNRKVYRSQLLLDQDRAVRSANLASLYRDAGMTDVSRREAARGVDADYANYSAHLFLAESYDALRDPKLINLRYETPFFTELLLANLLAPVGAQNLSQNVSQQEYSRLFAGDHFGMSSSTEYSSRGDWVQSGSQYGVIGNSSYAFDAFYRTENGYRPNNDLEQLNLALTVKQQLTPADSVLLMGNFFNGTSGDVAQYYNQDGSLPGVPAPSPVQRARERQEPNLFLGYHHEWAPGSHTLFLGGRLDDKFDLTSTARLMNLVQDASGTVIGGVPPAFIDPSAVRYRSDFTAYSAEAQQIWQQGAHTTVAGGRLQTGEVENRARQPVAQRLNADLDRYGVYAYHYWQVLDPVQLMAGLSYDYLNYPVNVDLPPFADGQRHKDQVSPKAGLSYTPCRYTTFRGIYTRSLGGVFYDTSVRLEPTQIAGFNQAFRSIIPESVIGLVPGSRFESFGLAWDQEFQTGTYLSVAGELLYSKGDREVGALNTLLGMPPTTTTSEQLGFRERSLTITLNQLLHRYWSLGASYRLSDADLNDKFNELTPALQSAYNRRVSATLHQVDVFANFYHACGFFARADAIWSQQSNRNYTPDIPGDDFWHFNAYIGYRLLDRRAELSVGLLNLGDRDYRLNPLTLYSELPRERTLLAAFKFYF